MKRSVSFIRWSTLSLSLALGTTTFAQTPPKPSEALMNAVRKGDLEAIKPIIEADATLVNGNARSSSPLYEAIQNGKAGIVSYLLEKGADPNQETYSQTPLMAVLTNYSNDWKVMADALVAKGVNINLNDREGQTPLMRVLTYGGNSQKDKVAWLISKGVDLNIRNRYGASALDLAINNSSTNIVSEILAASDVKMTDEKGNTALFTAVSSAKNEYVKLLLDKGADINAQNSVGDTVLHLAAARPSAMLTTLLSAGARTDLKNHRGDLALHVALRRREENSDPSMVRFAMYGGTVIRTAPAETETATPRGTLIAPLTEKSDINARDQLGLSPLMLALESRDQESRDLIMTRTPKMDATMKLFDAASQGNVAEVKTLLTQKPFLVYFRLADGTTPLHISALWGTLGVTQLLVQKGADVNSRDSQGQTPLHEALTRPTGLFARRSKNMVAFLLEKGANPSALDATDTTPLHRAVKTGNVDLVEALLAKKVNVNERDNSGQTPLFGLMTKTADINIIKTLLDKGALVNLHNSSGITLLGRAVQTRRPELVSLLLDKGADVSIKDTEGRTAIGSLLNYGGGDETVQIVSLLLAKGADPNERIYGESLIYRAISNDSKEIVRALLASKKLNLKSSGERQSPLMMAVNYGRKEIVGILLDAGADPNEKDSQGRTLLKMSSSKEIGDLLRAKGAKEE